MKSLFYAVLLCVWNLSVLAQTPRLTERDDRYRIQQGDVLEIRFRYTPEFNETVSVQPDGFIDLQLVGECKIMDLTVGEATEVVRKRLETRLTNPQITVILKEFQKPFFMVGGEVASPGRYELRGKMTVFEAITISGGFKPSSLHSQVILVRRVSGDVAETKIVDVKNILSHRNFSEDPDLKSGDLVVVPQNKVSKIERFVKWGNYGIYATPAIH
jgi:polysaccharide export outer membrane protein